MTRPRLSGAAGGGARSGLLPSGGAGAASGAAPGSCLPPPRDKKVRGRRRETQSTRQDTAATLQHVAYAMAARAPRPLPEPLPGRYRTLSLCAGAGSAHRRRAPARRGGNLRRGAAPAPEGRWRARPPGRARRCSPVRPAGQVLRSGVQEPQLLGWVGSLWALNLKRRSRQEGAFGSPLPNPAISAFQTPRVPLDCNTPSFLRGRKKKFHRAFPCPL